jgi:hypothetical protein
MSGSVEWVAITKFKPQPIGAVGFIDNKAVAIAAFYDDNDANQDGNVDVLEWAAGKLLFNLNGKAVAEVAMQARIDEAVIFRDPSFGELAGKIFVNFAAGLVKQGVYKVYFARGVSMTGSALATVITSNMVKQIVIHKGFEVAAKKAFETATS